MEPPKVDPSTPQTPPMPEFRKPPGFWKIFFSKKEAVTGLVLSTACMFLALRILNDKRKLEAATQEWEKVNREVQRKQEENERLVSENTGLKAAFDLLRERVLKEVKMSGRRLGPLEERLGTVFSEVDPEAPGSRKSQGVNDTMPGRDEIPRPKRGFII